MMDTAAMSRARGGLTLLELLVVIVIFVMLLGMTIYFIQGIGSDLGVDASAHQVASQLRGVHQIARSNAIPGWVLLNVKTNSVSMLTGETVGEWHFEEANPEEGAFGRPARLSNAQTEPGRIGHALRMGRSGGANCGEIPVFTPDQGFALEFWFRSKGGSGKLCSIGNQVEISVSGNGTFSARAGTVSVDSGQIRLPRDTWCRVQLIHSGRDVRLILNRNQVDKADGKMYWSRPETLTIGDGRSGARGLIDEFRVSIIVPREAYYLPAETKFALIPDDRQPPEDGEIMVAFDGEGRLDPSVHNAAFRIAVQTTEERKEIEVGLGGNVRTIDAEPPARPAPPANGQAPGSTKTSGQGRQ